LAPSGRAATSTPTASAGQRATRWRGAHDADKEAAVRNRRRRSRLPTPLLAAALLVLLAIVATACGEPDQGGADLTEESTPTPTPTPGLTPTPTPDLTPTPTPVEADETDEADEPFEGDTDPVTLEGAAEQETAVLAEVRVARHEGFDRVVWEFGAGERPRIWLEYTDDPRQPGSGEPVDVAGDVALHLAAERATDRGAELYAPDHEPYDGPDRVEGANTERVTEAVALGDFEANMQWAVGVDARQPFRVEVLEDPLRIVVDVAH
jgi:hypothetical protein